MSKEEEERIATALVDTGEPDQGRTPDKDNATEERTRRGTVIAVVLLALLVFGLAASVGYFIYTRETHSTAKEQCSVYANPLEEASTSRAVLWRKAWAVGSYQVKDARTMVAMSRAVKDAGGIKPETIRCDASMSSEDLKAASRKAEDLGGKYKKLDKAAKAVLASRDAKNLDDARAALAAKKKEASRLLGDSDGKVADNATREALQNAIGQAGQTKGDKAQAWRDAVGPLQSAIDQVNASMQAKAQADQQAAEQAAQETAPSYGGGYIPSSRPSYGQGGGGGWSDPAPVQRPTPSTPNGGGYNPGVEDWMNSVGHPVCQQGQTCGIG